MALDQPNTTKQSGFSGKAAVKFAINHSGWFMSVLGIFVALASAAPQTPAVDPDTVVRCVRQEVTGSLARTQRVCHTVGEWRRINSDANDEVRRTTQPGSNNSNG